MRQTKVVSILDESRANWKLFPRLSNCQPSPFFHGTSTTSRIAAITWAILPRTAERAPVPFALTRAPIEASIALPCASARSSSLPSIPPRDTCGRPRRKSKAGFSSLWRFPSAGIFACASTDSERLLAAPARKAPSTSKKEDARAAWSNLLARERWRGPGALFPWSQTSCAPVRLTVHWSR
jgi:hypothetical protein